MDIKLNINPPSLNNICTHCFGTGKLKAMQSAMTYDAGPIRDKDTTVKCSKCGGKGVVDRE